MYDLLMGLTPLAVMGLMAIGATIISARLDGVPPCETCGGRRWRTITKGRAWRCRACGREREAASVIPIKPRLSGD